MSFACRSTSLFARVCKSCSRNIATALNTSVALPNVAENFLPQVFQKIPHQRKEPMPEVEEKLHLYQPWTICRLEEKDLINQAKSLMYRVFVKELGWKHAENTPTGFAIKTLPNGEKILDDKLDSQAVWFGVVHEDQVIASMRRLNRDEFGHLDITRYPSSRKSSLASIFSPIMNPRLTELQRIVIDTRFRSTTVLPWLFYYAFNDIYENNLNVVGSASSRKLRSFLTKHCRLGSVDSEFYYTENMDGPASVFYIENEDLPRFMQIVTNMIKHGKKC